MFSASCLGKKKNKCQMWNSNKLSPIFHTHLFSIDNLAMLDILRPLRKSQKYYNYRYINLLIKISP